MNFLPHRRAAVLLVLVLAVAVTSCSTTTAPRGGVMPAVAIAVTSTDGSAPSAGQLTQIHQALQPEFQRVGFRFAESRNTADLIVIVRFTPTPGGSGGRVAILGIEPGAEFRRAMGNGETEEEREHRRRLREYEQWAQRQNREP